MPGFNLSLDFHFRRKHSGRGGTDETEVSLTCSIAIILAVVLAMLVATGVITPDTFARMRAKALPSTPAPTEVITPAAASPPPPSAGSP